MLMLLRPWHEQSDTVFCMPETLGKKLLARPACAAYSELTQLPVSVQTSTKCASYMECEDAMTGCGSCIGVSSVSAPG